MKELTELSVFCGVDILALETEKALLETCLFKLQTCASPSLQEIAIKMTQLAIGQDPLPVSFWQLLRYSNVVDKIFLILGWIVSVIAGLAIPLLNINFGQMMDVYVKYDDVSHFHHHDHHSNATAKNQTCISSDEVDEEALREFRDKSFSIAFNILSLGFIYFFLCYFFSIILDKIACKILYRTKVVFYESLLKQETAWFDESSALGFAQEMENEMSKMEEGIGSKTGLCLYMMSTSTTSLLTAVYYGWELTFILLALTPLFALLSSVVAKIHVKSMAKCHDSLVKADAVGGEILGMIDFIVRLGGEVKSCLRLQRVLDDAVKSHASAAVTSSLYTGLIWLSNYLTYALGVWYGSNLIIVSRETSSSDYSVGDIIVIFWSVLSITYYAGRTGPFLVIFDEARSSAARVFRFIDRETMSHARGMRPNQFQPTIRFDRVCLTHPRSGESLKNFSFHAHEGQTIAIVGEPESGVSLIAKLLSQFFEQDSGSIFIGDFDIADLNLEWLRFNVALVGKHPVIFDGTIHDNIWMANKTSVTSDVVHAARVSNCTEFIMALNDAQLQSVIGSKGVKLSIGQKQRISIAKAIIKQSKILVLDRITSLIPSDELDDVLIAIERSRLNKTTIIVSESITSSVQNCDHILVMKDGLVREEGCHDELLLKQGVYKQMMLQQQDSTALGYSPRMETSSSSFRPSRAKRQIVFETRHSQNEGQNHQEYDEQKNKNAAAADDEAKRQEEDSESGKLRGRLRGRDQNQDNENEETGKTEHEERQNSTDEQQQQHNDSSNKVEEKMDKKKTVTLEPRFHQQMRESEEDDKKDDKSLKYCISSDLSAHDDEDQNEGSLYSSSCSSGSMTTSVTTSEEMREEAFKRSRKASCAFAHKYSCTRLASLLHSDMPLVIMAGMASALFGVAIPLYAVIVGDFMMVLESSDSDTLLSETKIISFYFILLSIFVSVSSFTSSFLFSLLEAKLARKLKAASVKSLLSQDLIWFDVEENSPEILKKSIFNEVNTGVSLIAERIGSFSQAAGTVTACFVISLYLNWKMGLVVLSLMPFIMYRSVLVSRATWMDSMETSKIPRRVIRSIRRSSCLQHQARFISIFDSILKDEVHIKEGNLQMKGQAWGLVQCIPVISYGIVFLFGSYFVQEHTLHYTDLFKIVEGVIFGSILVSEGVLFSCKLQQLKTAMGHLFHVIDSNNSSGDVYSNRTFTTTGEGGTSFPETCRGSIEFSCLDYRSPSEPFDDLLNSFSLKIPSGNRVSLMDVDGDLRGRMALTGLIERMLTLRHGMIFLDGHDISSLHTSWLRSQIGVISATPQLLSLSIGDNISFGDNNRYVPFEEVIQAAKVSGIHDFIMTLPLGYHTACDGCALNHEQRLRISIARALIRNPAVMLIEDILSGINESSIYSMRNVLEAVMMNRTVVYMPSFFGWNNSSKEGFRIILMEKGSILEDGDHETLMSRKGTYFSLSTACIS